MENIGAPTMSRTYEQYLRDLAAEKEANDATRHSCVCNCMLCTEGKPLPCLPLRHIDKIKAKEDATNRKTHISKERIAFVRHMQEKIPSGPHFHTWPREYEKQHCSRSSTAAAEAGSRRRRRIIALSDRLTRTPRSDPRQIYLADALDGGIKTLTRPFF